MLAKFDSLLTLASSLTFANANVSGANASYLAYSFISLIASKLLLTFIRFFLAFKNKLVWWWCQCIHNANTLASQKEKHFHINKFKMYSYIDTDSILISKWKHSGVWCLYQRLFDGLLTLASSLTFANANVSANVSQLARSVIHQLDS